MRSLFITAVALVIVQAVSAQVKTTWEEFNYINSALAIDKKTGRDIKSGYTMNSISEESVLKWNDGTNRSMQLFLFKKGTENRAMILRCSDSKGGESYYCFPTVDSDTEMWNRAYANFQKFPGEWHQVISWGMIKLFTSKMPKSS